MASIVEDRTMALGRIVDVITSSLHDWQRAEKNALIALFRELQNRLPTRATNGELLDLAYSIGGDVGLRIQRLVRELPDRSN